MEVIIIKKLLGLSNLIDHTYERLTQDILCKNEIEKSNIELLANDEQFVKVKEANSYYISNYGRLIFNNDKYELLKSYTDENNGRVYYNIDGGTTYADRLVADYFLEPIDSEYNHQIIHIDGCNSNNYYKNLSFDDEFVYIHYANIRDRAYKCYYNMIDRVSGKYQYNYGMRYDGVTVCDEWFNDKEKFIDWYVQNYYECAYEAMELDKDLLVRDNKIYGSNTCCILPKSLNILISTCHQKKGSNLYMPLGVRKIYVDKRPKYQGIISINSKPMKLPLRNRPKAAFEDYFMQKKAQLMITAEQYKPYLPEHIYHALINYEIQPFIQTTYWV